MTEKSKKMAAIFCENSELIGRVFAQGRRGRIGMMTNLYASIVSSKNFEEDAPRLVDLDVIFSTWGMPTLTPAQLDRLPNLKAVFYAAGSVQGFARPLLERGIAVFSSWGANAVPVAEFTMAQILLSNKGYFRNTRGFRSPEKVRGFSAPGNFGETVALLGCGQVGRKVTDLLRPFSLRVVVYDPFLSEAEAGHLGVKSVSLEDAFAHSSVISNHLPNLPTTHRMLTGSLFSSMRENATFINTGRGATVAEDEMIHVLLQRPDLTALLDVTDPEPPDADSPLYTMPNVCLSTHIAGSLGDEVVRLADYMIEEFQAWERGQPLKYAVTLPMLETMA